MSEQMNKPTVTRQGKIVIEPADKCPGFVLMFPNGDVVWEPNKRRAELRAKLWFRENNPADIGVGEIEWRINS